MMSVWNTQCVKVIDDERCCYRQLAKMYGVYESMSM